MLFYCSQFKLMFTCQVQGDDVPWMSPHVPEGLLCFLHLQPCAPECSRAVSCIPPDTLKACMIPGCLNLCPVALCSGSGALMEGHVGTRDCGRG